MLPPNTQTNNQTREPVVSTIGTTEPPRPSRRRRGRADQSCHPLVRHLMALASLIPDFSSELEACAAEINEKAHSSLSTFEQLIESAIDLGLNHEDDISDELKLKVEQVRSILEGMHARGLVVWEYRGTPGRGRRDRLWFKKT